MDNPSFAEIKERFGKMNVVPYHRPPASTINNESSLDPSISEKVKTESSNKSFGKI